MRHQPVRNGDGARGRRRDRAPDPDSGLGIGKKTGKGELAGEEIIQQTKERMELEVVEVGRIYCVSHRLENGSIRNKKCRRDNERTSGGDHQRFNIKVLVGPF